MSTRRPRIKAAAILPPKRSTRDGSASGPVKKESKIETQVEEKQPITVSAIPTEKEKVLSKDEHQEIPVVGSVDKPIGQLDEKAARDDDDDDLATKAKPTVDEVVKTQDTSVSLSTLDSNENIFKSPPVVVNHKRADSFSTSDIENEKIDENNALRSLQGPLSPVKFRQRIRPTPFFGMRRNSTQGYGSDIEEEPRRQRHTSTSSNTGTPTPTRIRPSVSQHIRTESTCSNFSDFTRDPSAKSTRKQNHSDNHLRSHSAKREFLSRFNGKPPERSHMKMSDLIFYNPQTNPMTAAELPPKVEVEILPKTEPITPVKEAEKEPADTENRMPVPQLKLGPDGEMILDEQSLVIETTAEKEARQTLASSKVIYMDEFSGNNGFYRRTKRTKDWPPEETIRFYRCLHTVGTDFSLMLTLFPKRSRRDLKLKFKKEERNNLHLINKALQFPKTFNIADLKTQLDREQEEYEAKLKHWEEIKKQAALQKKKKPKSKAYISKAAQAMTNGNFIYETELVSPTAAKDPLKPKKRDAPEKKRGRKPKEYKTTENFKEEVNPIDVPQKVVHDPIESGNTGNNAIEEMWIVPDVVHTKIESTVSGSQEPDPLTVASEIVTEQPEESFVESSNVENYTYEYYPSNPAVVVDDEIVYQVAEIENKPPISQVQDRILIHELAAMEQNETYDSAVLSHCSSPPIITDEIEDPPAPGSVTNSEHDDADLIEIVAKDESFASEDQDDCILSYAGQGVDDEIEDVDISAKDIDAEMERFMLHDLGTILTNLINGSLVVVASEDENDSNKVINEIYVMCKTTGALSEKPLDLPEDVVNCIVEELNAN